MIIEMRTYKTKPGLRSRFLEIFRFSTIQGTNQSTSIYAAAIRPWNFW
jgi:hypothetical protein